MQEFFYYININVSHQSIVMAQHVSLIFPLLWIKSNKVPVNRRRNDSTMRSTKNNNTSTSSSSRGDASAQCMYNTYNGCMRICRTARDIVFARYNSTSVTAIAVIVASYMRASLSSKCFLERRVRTIARIDLTD